MTASHVVQVDIRASIPCENATGVHAIAIPISQLLILFDQAQDGQARVVDMEQGAVGASEPAAASA